MPKICVPEFWSILSVQINLVFACEQCNVSKKIYILKFSDFTRNNFWWKKRMQNDRNTYEKCFRIPKKLFRIFTKKLKCEIHIFCFYAHCGNTRINVSRQRKYIFENGRIFVVFQLDSASFKPIGGRFTKKIGFFSVEFSNIILKYRFSL